MTLATLSAIIEAAPVAPVAPAKVAKAKAAPAPVAPAIDWTAGLPKDRKAMDAFAAKAGRMEGAASGALPNVALAFANLVLTGKATSDNASEIYIAYGKARNASGTGKRINTDSEGALKAPVSKLKRFADLAAVRKTMPGKNITIGQAFFDTYAADFDLWTGDHYERLYKAAALQMNLLAGKREFDGKPEARLVTREEILAVIDPMAGVAITEEESFEKILKAIDLHINGQRDKDGNVNPMRPAFGDTSGELKRAFEKLTKVQADRLKLAKRDFIGLVKSMTSPEEQAASEARSDALNSLEKMAKAG